MIAWRPEQLLSLSAAARRVGAHRNSIARWIVRGVRGVRLQSVRRGGRRFVTEAWLEAFFVALDPDDDVSRHADVSRRARRRSGRRRRRRVARVEAEALALGI